MYLAEWKPSRYYRELRGQAVLIVPCGMETELLVSSNVVFDVLIVPCGMETSKNIWKPNAGTVLIVPCGMETFEHGRYFNSNT